MVLKRRYVEKIKNSKIIIKELYYLTLKKC